MQWYPGDWQRDFGVRSCSLAARGLWREMLDVMHDGEPRGTMQVGRKIISHPAEIAALVAAKPGEDVAALLAELEAADVFSRNEAGAIYSRRMVRDTYISDIRRASGSEGGKVAQAKVRGKIEEPPAVADAESKEQVEEIETLPAELNTPTFREAWERFRKYRVERKLPVWKPVTIKTKLSECLKAGPDASIQAIDHAIGNGWNSFFPAKVAARPAFTDRQAALVASLKDGSKAERVDGPSTQARLAALAASLPDALAGVAGWRLGILRLTATASPEAVEQQLAKLDAELITALRDEMSAERLAAIDAKVRAAVAKLAQRGVVGQEATDAAARLWTFQVREHYGIPVLSLFSEEAKAA